MPKFVYDFAEGNRDLKDLLGGKGANLAEMTNLGLPVPPGFTITTEACTTYLRTGEEPAELADEVTSHLEAMEKAIGRRLGDPADPLLVSVRSGAKFSMPGMMETVLNIGLNDESVQGLARQADNERFAWDSYRRLIQMFGKTVLGIEGEHFEDAHRRGEAGQGHEERPRPRRRRPAEAGRDVQGRHPRARRPRLPAGPARADEPRHPRRLRLVERGPRDPLPPPGAHPGRPRHRGQRAVAWSSATRRWTPAPASPSPATRPPARRASTATTCRTRRARTSSPASATRCRWPTWRASTSRRTTS